jgi:hypothetical protein
LEAGSMACVVPGSDENMKGTIKNIFTKIFKGSDHRCVE